VVPLPVKHYYRRPIALAKRLAQEIQPATLAEMMVEKAHVAPVAFDRLQGGLVGLRPPQIEPYPFDLEEQIADHSVVVLVENEEYAQPAALRLSFRYHRRLARLLPAIRTLPAW
jgi:hypothetical protein